MSDLVIFVAPMVAGGKSLYYLTRPNGAVTKLDIRVQPPVSSKNNTQIYYLKSYKFKVFNPNIGCSFNCSDVVSEKLAKLTANEFVVGPLDEEDHGEWLLTVYNRNNDSHWLEIRQKIYIKVTATINLDHGEVRPREGNAFEIGFPYAMKDIMKCELVVPSGTVSQLYKGRKVDLQTCRYEVSNVTKQDSGYWKIIGHGSILYRATLHVLIIPKNNTTTTKPEDGARTTTLATTFSYFLKFISI